MRILYLSPDPGVPVLGAKGASVHLRALVSAFNKLGEEVVVASPRVEPAENFLPAAVSLVEIPPVLPKTAATAADLRNQAERQALAVADIARRQRIDTIYERHSLASFAGARTAAALGVPLLLEVNAPLRAEAARFRQLLHEEVALAAEEESFAAATRIFVISRALKGWLEGSGVAGRRVDVVPNAFPERDFAVKQPLGDDDEVVVGFAGGLKLWHGIGVLLAGFEQALARGARMRLEVAGTGPAEHLLSASTLPPERLCRLGHLPHEETLDRLEEWDVGVAPFTALEDFYFSPLKLFEYMAAGVCPVASDVGELAEILDRGEAGVLVAPDSATALADALLALDCDRARLRALGGRAREKAKRGPTWADNANRVIAALADREAV